MMPRAKILACSKAPPENMLMKPKSVPERLAKALPNSALPHERASKTLDEGVADVEGADEDEFDEERLQRQQQERDDAAVEKAAEANGKGGVKIGFFLNTPFPSSEIYRILPVRREILLGVLQCDLIG